MAIPGDPAGAAKECHRIDRNSDSAAKNFSALVPSDGTKDYGRRGSKLSSTGRAPIHEVLPETPGNGKAEVFLPEERIEAPQSLLPYLQLFWQYRRFLLRAVVYSVLASALVAFLIPVRFQSVTRLMPPDAQSGSTLGMLAAMAGRSGAGLSGIAGDLLGVKSSGGLFVGILNSESAQEALIQKFDLKKVYRDSKIEDARKDLAERTDEIG